jgi:hypothetical protein
MRIPSTLALTALFATSTTFAFSTASAEELDVAAIESAMAEAELGSPSAKARAQKMLIRALKRIDREWGGAFDGNGSHAKSTAAQAELLRLAARGYAAWGTQSLADAASAIEAHVADVLASPSGAFYAGQAGTAPDGIDAKTYFRLDDAGRRAHGLPEVDARIDVASNALMIRALAAYYDVTRCARALVLAERAAHAIAASPMTDTESKAMALALDALEDSTRRAASATVASAL